MIRLPLTALLVALAATTQASAATNLNQIATTLTGTPTTVACVDESIHPELDGWVQFDAPNEPEPVIYLHTDECNDLASSQASNAFAPGDWLAITHEAMHIRLRTTNECLVERLAVANIWQAVRLFRLPAWRARMILQQVPNVDANLPAQYHEGC